MKVHYYPAVNADPNGLLLILGGIGPPGSRFLEILQQEVKRFRHVVYIPGVDVYKRAHDNVDNVNQWIESLCHTAKVHYLNHRVAVLDGVKYAGALGWSSKVPMSEYENVFTAPSLRHLTLSKRTPKTAYGHQVDRMDIQRWEERDTQFLKEHKGAVRVTYLPHPRSDYCRKQP